MTYEKDVNEEAEKVALHDLSLLCKREVLYEKAKENVRCASAFVFKRGKSQSNLAMQPTPPVKRRYRTEMSREDHISKLVEDIDGKQKQVKFKLLHQTKAQASKDWETCERLQSEVNMLRKEIHSLEKELKVFKRKWQKSTWFKKKKKSASVKENTDNQLIENIDQQISKNSTHEKEDTESADDSQDTCKFTHGQEHINTSDDKMK